MRFDLSLTILLLQVLTSSGEQAFLSQPNGNKYTQYDIDLKVVENGSAGEWKEFNGPQEYVYLA
jgi:hypothetical protein